MTVFSKVVTGVKRRIPANEAPPPSAVPRVMDKPQTVAKTVAPDLRRFSDFMNPFPTVSPGGYTKYYQAKSGADSGPSQYALPSLCELNQRPPSAPRRPPTIQTSGLAKSKSRPSRHVIPSSHTLASIPETSSETHSQKPRNQSTSSQGSSSSPHASLRRRKRRLLRTPSVERDFAQHGVLDSELQSTLNRAASVLSNQSSSTFGSPHSSDSSTDSHSSNQSSPASDSPLTPVTNFTPPHTYMFKDPYHHRKKLGAVDWEPFERPDSRSTYRTARTHFDDI